MQIRALQPYSLNGQWSLKGSVVNMENDINQLLQDSLPRSFNEMSTVQLKLKRKREYKQDYMFETIRPARVCEALKYLIDTPLYKENKISIDKNYLEKYENC